MKPEDAVIQGLKQENAAGKLREFLATAPDFPAERYAGRGIVTCAGGIKYGVPAWVLVNAIRHYGCTLPIQVWYRGAGEYVPALAEMMRPLGVEWIDAFAVRDSVAPHPRLNGFEIKPFSILHCPWREVIFLDADNVPLFDVTTLFNWPQYQDAGTVFWPDYHKIKQQDPLWQVYGVPYRDTYRVETGQIVIDKARAWPGLLACNWACERSKFFFRYGYGDLGPFQFGWLASGTGYVMVPHKCRALYHAKTHRTICQHDFAGKRIFQHHNTAKWSLAKPVEAVDGFQGLGLVRTWLDSLRAIWSPATGTLATPEDAAEIRGETGRRFEYRRFQPDGERIKDSRKISLGRHGLIDEGAARCETYWTISGGRLLIAASDGSPIAELDRTPRGWRGRWVRYERMACELVSE